MVQQADTAGFLGRSLTFIKQWIKQNPFVKPVRLSKISTVPGCFGNFCFLKRGGKLGKSAVKKQPYPLIRVLECKACGRCIIACPKGLLTMSDDINMRGYHYVEYSGADCNGCANCYYNCPEPLAIEIHIPEKD